jgi:hypothetical protein
MPQQSSSTSKQRSTKTPHRSPFNRSPYREKTLAIRVPESLVPQVRKMLEQCSSDTAQRVKALVKASMKAELKPTPSVKAKVKTKAKPHIETSAKSKPKVRR